MMYKSLKSLSYSKDFRNILETEYETRFNSYSTIKTNLFIHPFFAEQRKIETTFELFYVPLPEHLIKSEYIQYKSDEIRKLSNELPGLVREKIIISNIIEEIQSTNDFEGVRSSKQEIGIAVEKRNTDTPVRFNGIVNMYMNLEEEQFEIIDNYKKFRDIYDELFKGEMLEKDLPDGDTFREGPVIVGNNNKIVHRGNPNEQLIIKDLKNLTNFMNNKKIPYLTKCIISHYFLEYIHPFYDGNGRLGRFLISSYLTRKLDPFTGISISNAVNNNKKKYSEAFLELAHPKNYGDTTLFVESILDLISFGQEQVIKQLEDAKLKMEFAHIYVNSMNLSNNARDILYIHIQNHLFDSINDAPKDIELRNFLKCSRYVGNKAFKELENLNLLEKAGKSPSCHTLSVKVLEDISWN